MATSGEGQLWLDSVWVRGGQLESLPEQRQLLSTLPGLLWTIKKPWETSLLCLILPMAGNSKGD